MATVSADHYFSAQPRTPARSTEIVFDVAGRTFTLAGSSGVFSATRLDPGTGVLLRKAPLPGPATDGAVLDLGCGYGPITCVLATVAPEVTVYAVDVNDRALDLVRANAQALSVDDRVIASTPAGVPAELRFTEIWSNPPIRVGKEELHAILELWLPRLRPGGTAWLVVARHKGADSLAQWLQAGGWQVRRHASQQGFRVLAVSYPDNSGDVGGADEGHS
jgi:16S rRNA (guanine1207-N2)-methyltransferase